MRFSPAQVSHHRLGMRCVAVLEMCPSACCLSAWRPRAAAAPLRDAQPWLDPGHGTQTQSLAGSLLPQWVLALPGRPQQPDQARQRPSGWEQTLLQRPDQAPRLRRLSGGSQWQPLHHRIFQRVSGTHPVRSALQSRHGWQCMACHRHIVHYELSSASHGWHQYTAGNRSRDWLPHIGSAPAQHVRPLPLQSVPGNARVASHAGH